MEPQSRSGPLPSSESNTRDEGSSGQRGPSGPLPPTGPYIPKITIHLQHQPTKVSPEDLALSGSGRSEERPAPEPDGDQALPRFGRYTVERVLGRVGFKTVYPARDNELQRQVAIKVPRRPRAASGTDLDLYL
jgi:hypothetical protein